MTASRCSGPWSGSCGENEFYQVIVEDLTDTTGTKRLVGYATDTKYILPVTFRPKNSTLPAHHALGRVGRAPDWHRRRQQTDLRVRRGGQRPALLHLVRRGCRLNTDPLSKATAAIANGARLSPCPVFTQDACLSQASASINTRTLAADCSSAWRSSGWSSYSMTRSNPPRPSCTGTPKNRSFSPYSPCK